MNTYCVKCRKDAGNIDPKIVRTKNNSHAVKMFYLWN